MPDAAQRGPLEGGERSRPDQPGPLMRRGPRPLLLHLMLAWMRSNASTYGSLNSNSAWLAWSNLLQHGHPAPPTPPDPPTPPNPADPPDLAAIMGRATPWNWSSIAENDREMIAGIAAYRRHPSQRFVRDPPVVWQEREARLLDFAPGAPGRPVLFVPSLINRAYILDLTERRSLMRFLAKNGARPLLLDWGWPGEAERRYTLTDYIAGTLERALDAVGQPVTLVGYCMGGLLTVAMAQRRPDRVAALGLLAVPWDFRTHEPERADSIARLLPLIKPLLDLTGAVPIDVLQSLFALLDAESVAEKFRRFGRLDQNGARARLFVAIEDWANDGVPLAAPVARECFADWYGRNAPCRGEWRIAGQVVAPECVRRPSFVAVPGRDRIVPPESAMPLAERLHAPTIIKPMTGHVGMIAGEGAEAALWRPLLDWLRSI